MPSTTLPRGNVLLGMILEVSLTPVAVALSDSAEQNFTVAGLAVNDFVTVNADAAQTAGVGIVNARVSAANTLTVMFSNSTAGNLTPVAGNYLIKVERPENSNLALPINVL